jgi:hypothetical protein
MYGPERQSTRSSSYIHDEMKYTRDDSTLPNDELKDTKDSAAFPGTPSVDYPPVFDRIDSNVSSVEEVKFMQIRRFWISATSCDLTIILLTIKCFLFPEVITWIHSACTVKIKASYHVLVLLKACMGSFRWSSYNSSQHACPLLFILPFHFFSQIFTFQIIISL